MFELISYCRRLIQRQDYAGAIFVVGAQKAGTTALHPDINKEWQYITVPLRNRGQFDKICDISINSKERWKEQILGKLTSYKKKAPNYKETLSFVRECLEVDETNLSKFLSKVLKKTVEVLHINTPIHMQSEIGLNLGMIQHPGQWALRISEQMGATEYINPHGGSEIFDENEFKDAGIRLSFLRPRLEEYIQKRGALFRDCRLLT